MNNPLIENNTEIQGQNIFEIMKNPDQYPDELLGACLDLVKNRMIKQLNEAKIRIEGNLIARMKKDNASKMEILDINGEKRTLTLKKGSMSPVKNADIIYAKNGFDPLEIGEYVFKASWTKAKESRKFGDTKQLVIDEIFEEGKESLMIA